MSQPPAATRLPMVYPENSELVLAPKETTQMVVLINVPKDALPGGHYAGVFFDRAKG